MINTESKPLKDRTIIITGASRGIGKTMALTFARAGARIVAAAKTTRENPRLPGTIHSTVQEIEAEGGIAMAISCNVRHMSELKNLVDKTLETYGRIDGLVNNAGAIWLQPIEETPEKRFDLVHEVNFKAPFMLSQLCLPHLQKQGGHIINMSPPIEPDLAGGKIAYMASKFNMTLLTIGLGNELKGKNVACNSLWPKTLVESLATINWGMGKPEDWRKADIMADAALLILQQNPNTFTGQALIDEDILREIGNISDFTKYNVVPEGNPKLLDWNLLLENELNEPNKSS